MGTLTVAQSGSLGRRYMVAAALWALAAWAAACQAQPAWVQPINLVVPYPAGGGSDLTARIVARRLEAVLEQPVVVVNRPGAETEIAMRFVAHARADGLTLLLGVPTITTNPLLNESAPNWRPQLEPLAKLTEMALVMLASKNLGVNDFSDLQRAVRDRRITRINCGAAGASTTLGCLFLQKRLGDSVVNIITYKGNAPALTDLMGGHIDVLFDLSSAAKPAVESSAVKALAKTSSKPLPAPFADLLSTGDEMPDFVLNSWQGVFAPAGLPPATRERLENALQQITKDSQTEQSFRALGIQVAFLGSVAFGRFLDEERKLYEKLMLKLN